MINEMPLGAEHDYYAAEGINNMPSNRAFPGAAELLFVRGICREGVRDIDKRVFIYGNAGVIRQRLENNNFDWIPA